ncbi:uncharacterized protein LTR77_003802 [Saxophila tyrrhenica]|uniref:Zn(2)-C6 fungal-type domain-containing protein n=1 Tax=Saxophila tyrrhenica TaxID=1690608 RepID=A0AAV9PIY6_9PEZI|nr:hypothetical protein LTR77_003802 [Saxophila tyrrhenica]
MSVPREEVDGETSPPAAKKVRRTPATSSVKRKPASLACLNCRPRKIKCLRNDGACERCLALNLECRIPERDERKLRYSKEYIEGLESEIEELREALRNQQARSSESAISPTQQSDTTASSADVDTKLVRKEGSPPDSLIERLCGNKRRVNSNPDGQSRYFGPTSSLHLTETPSSISSYSQSLGADIDIDKGIPQALQHQMLDLYWTYQHPILHFVHKEAFLSCMDAGRGPYFSKCLYLCILASGARLSSDPHVRALSIPSEDDDNKSDRRPLMKQAEDALEKEITSPSVTTIQSLCLLSIMYCIQSNDTKGWMLSGNACRLVFDLGLHQDWTYLSATKLSGVDIELRQIVFWGCFNLDRLWALYLGRPPFIKLIDVSIRRPEWSARTWDLRIFAAWVHLLDTAGQIADKLNTNACTQGQIDHYSEALQQWYNSLDPTLHVETNPTSAVYHLHLQYSAMTILLNRHNAGFGNSEKRNHPDTIKSRQQCLHHASRVAQMLRDYKVMYGDGSTLFGSALYNCTMAATVLVAEISESRKGGACDEMHCLMECLRTMKEMEHTEIVAKNVFNIVQTIMRVCNVREDTIAQGLLSTDNFGSPVQRMEPPVQPPYDPSVIGLNQTTLAMWPAYDFEGISGGFPFAFEQPVMTNGYSGVSLPPMDPYYMT